MVGPLNFSFFFGRDGEVYENGNFKLFGRGSDADLRGCNLMLGDQNN